MTVMEQIKTDWIAARKARDDVVSPLLGTLIGAVTNKEKTFSPARPLTDAEVIAEVKKMLDGVAEMAKHVSADNAALVEKLAAEKAALEKYMPAQMSAADIEAFVAEKKAQGANLGQIMAALKAERPGMYDGRLASEIAKRVLA